MQLEDEIESFDATCAHLKLRIRSVSSVETASIDTEFIAEAICFRLFRVHERLLRSFFLHCCTQPVTLSGVQINSKLICPDTETAENILKGSGRFMEWGKSDEVKKISNLIFENGFPISDFILSNSQTMSDLHKIRNYIAHDSSEAKSKFVGVTRSYMRLEDAVPDQAGSFLLYRRRASESNVLTKLFGKVRQFSSHIQNF